MKRIYLLLLVAIAVAAVIGVAIAEHSGYVLIAYKNFRYESGLWAALGVLFAIWLVIFLVRMLINLLTASSGVVNPWSRRNRSRRVQVAIEHHDQPIAFGRQCHAFRLQPREALQQHDGRFSHRSLRPEQRATAIGRRLLR